MSAAKPPFRAVPVARPRVTAERRPDGSWLLRSLDPLPAPPRQLGLVLRRWADEA